MHITGWAIYASHPDYVMSMLTYQRAPGSVDFALENGGTIEGRIVDSVTQTPASNAVVSMVPLKRGRTNFVRQVRTNDDGHYRSPVLAPSEYAVWAEAKDRTCHAIESITARIDETVQAPDLSLIAGSWIEGKVVTDEGSSLPRDPRTGHPLNVSWFGPSHPKAADRPGRCEVDDDGRFRFRVAPGLSFIQVHSANNWLWERVHDRQKFDDGIEVKAGETVQVVIRVKNDRQMARMSSERLLLPLPVAAEDAAADAIRDCGGWYQLNDEGHIVEANMVYVEKDGKRYDNSYALPDFLPHLASLPFVERLYLKDGQVNDEGMKYVGQLERLKILMIWDGTAITDAGVERLRHLRNLSEIHLTRSQVTDQAIAYLAEIPTLEEISMQENQFTDQAVEYAARLPQLKRLYMSQNVTDEGLSHLAKIATLELAWLDCSEITVDGLEKLVTLKNLQELQLGNAKLPESAILTLQSALPNLKVITGERIFASRTQIRAANDPEQQKLNRREAPIGLAAIQKFLGLMSKGKTAEAGELYDPDLVKFLRPRLSDDEWSWIKIARVYGDHDAVLAVTTAKSHDQSFRVDQNGRTQRVTTFLFIVAEQKEGEWRIRECQFDDGSDARHVRYFRSEHVGALELVPSPEWLSDLRFGTPTPLPMKR